VRTSDNDRCQLVVTKPDLAQQLGCSVRTVNRLIARGDLPRPITGVGRRQFWRGETLARFFESRERTQQQHRR
jgi:predicted DNA-binding transcriptional regulator AlpA